jgi:hypothetical protein
MGVKILREKPVSMEEAMKVALRLKLFALTMVLVVGLGSANFGTPLPPTPIPPDLSVQVVA